MKEQKTLVAEKSTPLSDDLSFYTIAEKTLVYENYSNSIESCSCRCVSHCSCDCDKCGSWGFGA